MRFFLDPMSLMGLVWRAKALMRSGRTSADIRAGDLIEQLISWARKPPRYSDAEELAYACGVIDWL